MENPYKGDIKEVVAKCEEIISELSKWEEGFLDICGEDDDVCYLPTKEALKKMLEVRDFISSFT